MELKVEIKLGARRMEFEKCVSVFVVEPPFYKKIFYKACEIGYWAFIISLGALSLTLFRMPFF